MRIKTVALAITLAASAPSVASCVVSGNARPVQKDIQITTAWSPGSGWIRSWDVAAASVALGFSFRAVDSGDGSCRVTSSGDIILSGKTLSLPQGGSVRPALSGGAMSMLPLSIGPVASTMYAATSLDVDHLIFTEKYSDDPGEPRTDSGGAYPYQINVLLDPSEQFSIHGTISHLYSPCATVAETIAPLGEVNAEDVPNVGDTKFATTVTPIACAPEYSGTAYVTITDTAGSSGTIIKGDGSGIGVSLYGRGDSGNPVVLGTRTKVVTEGYDVRWHRYDRNVHPGEYNAIVNVTVSVD